MQDRTQPGFYGLIEKRMRKGDGFSFRGVTILNPLMDESNRFEVADPFAHYGRPFVMWLYGELISKITDLVTDEVHLQMECWDEEMGIVTKADEQVFADKIKAYIEEAVIDRLRETFNEG